MVTCWPCETLRAQRSSMPAVVLWLRVHVRGVMVLCGSQGNVFEHRKAPVPVADSPVGFGQPRQFGVAAPIMRPMAVVRPEEAEEVCASCMWRAPLWPVFCMPPAHLCLWLCLPLHGPFTPVRAVPVPIPRPVPARGLCVWCVAIWGCRTCAPCPPWAAALAFLGPLSPPVVCGAVWTRAAGRPLLARRCVCACVCVCV
jgi:hypothetical protein